MFILLKVKKSIFSIIFIIILANENNFRKNQGLLSFFFIQKLVKTIANILKVKLKVFKF